MSTPRLVTLVMTDLVGSTETVARLGSAGGERWRNEHISVLRTALAASGGRELQMLGDGVLAAFESTSAAVDFAASAQQRTAHANARRDALATAGLRIGIAVGEALQDDEGVHGLVVVEAARLCAHAQGGQTLASAVVETFCAARSDVRFTPLGALTLKGLSTPVPAVELISLDWRPASSIPQPPALVAAQASAFVGRDSERERLAAVWARVRAGERCTALIAGEPGIGKTRLAAELARDAAAAGAIVLHGRCDEDLSAPFQPWVQALRHYLDGAEPARLRAELGDRLLDLAPLLPEVGKLAPGATGRVVDPETDRLRLFDAVDALLACASRAAPLLVVLDDLHWADKPSLVLLKHLVRATQPAALLLVATYRETELVRTHPLAETLADLRRGSSVERLLLRGLDEAETGALLESREARELPAAFAKLLHAETSGNPFFIEEVLRHLVETGALRQGTGSLENVGIPESVREVVGRRLSRLSQTANQALGIAAAIGREFDLPTIEAAGGPTGDALLDAVEEAARARLVEEAPGAPGHFVFAHALVRQTLYEELGTTRRARLHWRIGDALEARSKTAPDDSLSAIAYHLCEGALAGEPVRAVDASLRAAHRAAALFAHEATVAHSRQALALLDQAGLDEAERRYELLMALGEASIFLAADHSTPYFEAAAIARRRGWAVREARAVIEATIATEFEAPGQDRHVRELELALSALPAGDSAERCKLLARLADNLNVTDFVKAEWLAEEALTMARRLGGEEELAVSLLVRSAFLVGGPRVDDIAALTQEAMDVSQRGGQRRLSIAAASKAVMPALLRGDRAAFERAVDTLRAAAERLRFIQFTDNYRALDALAAGRFTDARTSAAVLRDRRLGLYFLGVVNAARLEEGRLAEVATALDGFAARMPPWAQAYRAVEASARAGLGELERARGIFDELARDDFSALRHDWGRPLSLRHLAETCALLGNAEGARRLEPHLVPYAGLFLVPFEGTMLEGAADRALAQVLAVQGRFDEALERYASALALEEGFGATALAARTRYWWARALLERSGPGDRERAIGLARECVAVTGALGMTQLESSARSLLV